MIHQLVVSAFALATCSSAAYPQLIQSGVVDVLDNFNHPLFNNMGGIRSGWGVKYNLDGRSAEIPGSSDYLIETVGAHIIRKTLHGKSVVIQYTAQTAGDRAIEYLQLHQGAKDIDSSTSFQILAMFEKGRHVTVIPLSWFSGADLALAYGFKIRGPLTIHRIELTDDPQSSQVLPTSQEPVDLYHYVNSLQLRRTGLGISKLPTGISINTDGYLDEHLSPDLGMSDQGIQLFRFTYTSNGLVPLRVELYRSIRTFPQTITVPLARGTRNSVDVRVSAGPQFFDKIRILGPITIHRIELVSRRREILIDVPISARQDVVLVDDLTDWHCVGGGVSSRDEHGVHGDSLVVQGDSLPLVTGPPTDTNHAAPWTSNITLLIIFLSCIFVFLIFMIQFLRT